MAWKGVILRLDLQRLGRRRPGRARTLGGVDEPEEERDSR